MIRELDQVMARPEDNDVLQVWVADDRTDYYVLSTGEKGDCGINDLDWYHMAKESEATIVSDPYVDLITGISVVSIVTPVFSESGTQRLGYMG